MLRGLLAIATLALGLVASRLNATVDSAESAPPSTASELTDAQAANSVEAALLADAVDGQFDHHSLIRAVLIACGEATRADQPRTLDSIEAWLRRVAADPAIIGTQRERAQSLLVKLHNELLVGRYRADCSDVHQLVRAGDFNCVGAAVMYLVACAATGLRAVPQEMPGHVRCRVWLDGEWTVVEPTCREWFSVMNDPRQMDRLDVSAELRNVWRDPTQGRVLSEPALVAMIYYNRGLDRLEARDWPGAIAANQKALRLDPASRTARANLLAIWNNWALQRSEQGEHAEAESMLLRGMRMAPEFSTFRLNLDVVRQRRVDK